MLDPGNNVKQNKDPRNLDEEKKLNINNYIKNNLDISAKVKVPHNC